MVPSVHFKSTKHFTESVISREFQVGLSWDICESWLVGRVERIATTMATSTSFPVVVSPATVNEISGTDPTMEWKVS